MRRVSRALSPHRGVAGAIIIATLLLVSLTWGAFCPAAAQTPEPDVEARSSGDFKPGELLVKLREGVATAALLSIQDQYGAMRVRTLSNGDVEIWEVPEGRELLVAEQLNADPLVLYAEPNYLYQAFGAPNDPSLDKQWAHTVIQSLAAWDITTGSTGFTIAIIDSGLDLGHPDLAGKIVPGYDAVDGGEPWDENGHGTHVASIAAAVTNNGIGVAGMDWHARIMPVRVLNAAGSGWTSDVADGVYWAYQHGAQVLNLSLGGSGESQTLRDAVDAAHASGSLVVAAMGNCRTYDPPSCPSANPISYPAAYPSVLAVAATTRTDRYAYYSQYGNHCDIAAPGGDARSSSQNGILGALPSYDNFYLRTVYGYDKNYDYLQGTSMATPYVAGLAALVWGADPALGPDQLRQILENTADDLGAPGWDPNYGHGRINALAAVQAVAAPVAPTLASIDNANGDGTYLVAWNSVSNADSYTLQEDSNPAFPSPTVRYQGTMSKFTIDNQGGGTWYYRVLASNGVGVSPWSNIQGVSVKPAAPNLDPIDNASGEDAYVLIWSPSPGASYFTLEQADSPSFGNSQARYVGTALSYSVTGQPEGTWYYRVRAHNLAGSGPWSGTQSTMVNPPALEPPNLGEISNDDGDDSYLVTWTAVSGAATYSLEESRDAYFGDPRQVYSGPDLEFLVTGQGGGTWYYRVRALGEPGKSSWSIYRSVIVTSRLYLPLGVRSFRTSEPEDPIVNGDFEDGRTAWTQDSSRGWNVITDSGFPLGVTPHSGSWLAWLARVDQEIAHIEQQVTVPAEEPYLAYWHWIDSGDYCGFDYARVLVDGVQVDEYDLCWPVETLGWKPHFVDLGRYVGESITIQIRVETDESWSSSLFVDDVTFEAHPF